MSETTTTPPPAGTPAQQELKQTLQTEAQELKDDLKETKGELQQAKADGDTDRVAKLEASMDETKKTLGEIQASLKQLVERPFAPAPGDTEQTPAAPAGDEQQPKETEQSSEQPPEKPKKKHWLYGDRWNQE